ncbi:MAG: SDR family NAD(P)-dependent oxidoreductase [Verrucomicrobiales bacterium]
MNDPQPVALITGGQGNLGQALATELRAGGFSVFDPGHEELDVCSADSVTAYFKKIERIDLLVNNAGITLDGSILKMPEAEWDGVLDTNLKGGFRCAKAAFRIMLKQRVGHIVNIGSFSGVCPPAGQVNYAAAKAGLIGLTHVLADEGGKRSIRVNCVLPGFLETKMTRDLAPAVIESAKQKHVLGKFNTVDDVARFVTFLQSMEAVSGQVFQLDSRIRRWT